MISLDPKARYKLPRISIATGPLTDFKIRRYQKMGFYSAEYREARRKQMAINTLKRNLNLASTDNFFQDDSGRLIYAPR